MDDPLVRLRTEEMWRDRGTLAQLIVRLQHLYDKVSCERDSFDVCSTLRDVIDVLKTLDMAFRVRTISMYDVETEK